MSRKQKLLAAFIYCAISLASASLVFAQEKRTMIERRAEPIGQEIPPPDDIVFVGSEMGFSFDGKVVKGAPYSGEAVTETTQILGDGNRIVHKDTASVYRDKEGRTRREQTVTAIGPFGEMPQFISINDPVAGVSYVLEPNSRVAHRLNAMHFEFKVNANDEKPKGVLREKRAGTPGNVPEGPPFQVGTMAVNPGPGLTVEFGDRPNRNGKQESLGKQIIEGVEAEGTRMTTTIPAGEIGNERAIEIVSERWYSPELQTVVMSKHSDPRFGETVYRLININRGEQDASLFQVPSDYRMEEAPMPPMPRRIRVPEEK